MRLTLPALTALLLLAAGVGEAADRVAGSSNIPPEEWSAMAMGHTLTYKINGEFWALEHYYPGTNRVTLQINDGSCLQGTWEYKEPLYCFHWEGQEPACFRHARVGGEIVIIETQNGQDTPMTQLMTGVSDTPLVCGPATTS